ncbi:MAG: family 10 glycosylhydrolase [Verrucomicrobia bacterium]|nr:family 10 glycosylhydrolase [Verrucomicrobiota bacterium]
MKKPSFLKWSAAVASFVAAAEIFSSVARADEMRALWVDAFGNGFLSSSQVSQLVADCRTYNFNAVIVQMRRRGDAFYIPQAPNLEPRTTALAANYDALQEIINACNNGSPRIEVHVWAPAFLIWSDTTKSPPQAEHVYNVHPEYLSKTSGGSTQFAEGYYLDPGNPNAMAWNYKMARDIVSRYDIDGFHWDYIRYPQQDSGYNDVAIARYNAEFGLTGQPAASNSQFSNWRRRQVTDFLRGINSELLEIKPSLMLSASVFGSRTDALNARFQDWAAWNNEGIVDISFPMVYSTDNSIFTTRVNDVFNNQGVRRAYVGLGSYLNTKENTLTQLEYVRAKPFLGSALFSYRTPNAGTVNQAETLGYIRDNYQPTWEAAPALPWLANPTKGLVKGTVARQDNGEPIYNATVTVSGGANRTQKSEAHGKFAFFEVEPGTYTVSAASGGAASSPSSVMVIAGGIHNVDLTIDMPFIPDNTPPVISALRLVSVTSNACVIAWSTDELSDSTVEYGATSTYGETITDTTRVANHTIALNDLSPATTYQFRVISRDAAGNEASSANQQFSTPPAQSDLIIDNVDATVVGTWSAGAFGTEKYDADYRFKGRGTGAAYLQFTPQFAVSGNYQVFAWHPAGANRATNVPVVVTSLAGTQTYFVNQQINGGKWNYIGTSYFQAGAGGNVKVTDAFGDTTAGRVAMADAIRFTYLPDQQVEDIIMDNPAAAFTGTWSTGTAAGRFGPDYRFRSRGTGANFATYTLSIPVSGEYQVYEWHVQGSNRALNAPHIITHALGTQTVLVNQQINGAKWSLIGTFGFTAGSPASIRITDGFATPTNGVVMVDGIRLAYVPPPAPPATPSELIATVVSATQVDLSWDTSSSGSHFVVGRSQVEGGPYNDLATLPAGVASYSDTSVSADNTYFYVVRSVGIGGPSNNSSEASATTLPLAPSAPSGLTATASSFSQIDLAWADNEGGPEMVFVVSRSSSAAGPFEDVATVPARDISHSDIGLSPVTTYFYQVRAQNAGGPSDNSNVASATTLAALPAAASQVFATALSATRVIVTWTDNASNEEAVSVLRDSGEGSIEIATLGANATSYVDETASAHTSYSYVVRMSNFAGSADSPAATVTTPNTKPIAHAVVNDASTDANCEAAVVLDGSGSSDADNDALTYRWTGSFGTASGVSPSVTLARGTHVITLTVDDGFGGIDSVETTVEVADTTAPDISSLISDIYYLTPVNHKLLPVTLTAVVSDSCDPAPATRIIAITSNQPDNGTGDGNTVNDWVITGDMTCNLRAEREGSKSDRIYTVTVESVDASGNSSTRDIQIIAPHDNRTSN